MKYIVIEINHTETVIIFPKFIKHKNMAKRVLREGEKVLSAGFISFDEASCFGKSITLGVGSRPTRDNLLLEILTS